MKYQVAGHKRKIQIGVIPYDVVCEFDDLIQMYYMMDKVEPSIYDSILVIDTYTNEVVASRELDEPYTRKRRK
jgi:hypothetical protein